MLAMEMYTPARISSNCANHCVMVVCGRRGAGIRSRRHIENSITGGGTKLKFNCFFLLSRHTAHYALMCVSHSRKRGFDSARPHYWQAST